MDYIDKNNKIITENGKLCSPQYGTKFNIYRGDDNNLWVFIGDFILPISAFNTKEMIFIEE